MKKQFLFTLMTLLPMIALTTFISCGDDDDDDNNNIPTVKLVKSISLSEKNIELKKGETKVLTITVSPSDAANKKVVWASNNPTIAFPNQNGLVTAVNVGNCVITCQAVDRSGVKAECEVSVKENNDSGNNDNQENQSDIIVTVDASGNADGGHRFTKIGESNFYIDDIKYTAQNGDLYVTGYNEAFFKGAANIISVLKYNGRTLNVVGIGESAFYDCTSLTSITIPNSVTNIEDRAFYGCTSLTSITIPEGVTYIGYYAFRDCKSLTSITMGSGVTSIGIGAFSYCSSLTSITIPENVTSIGGHAFYQCTSLTSVTIPNSVTGIGGSAFEGCTSLTSVTIGNRVTYIGDEAFRGCRGLTSVTIPNSVTGIGGSAFEGCTSLTSITIGNSVKSISDYAFYGCSSLTSITIPNSVTSIGQRAFYDCSRLTSVTIGNSVTSIGSSAFEYCSGLTDVWCYAENVPSTGDEVFWFTPSSRTLHVPAGSVNAYKTKLPWSLFKSIVAIE